MTYTRDLENALKSALDEIGNLQNMIDWHNQKNIEWQDKYDAETNTLKARVAELEVEEKQVCEWKCVKYSPPGFKQYWIYYPPHNVSYWISAIGKEDYIFCPTCGKRIKRIKYESEE